jgi:hypothetical protein
MQVHCLFIQGNEDIQLFSLDSDFFITYLTRKKLYPRILDSYPGRQNMQSPADHSFPRTKPTVWIPCPLHPTMKFKSMGIILLFFSNYLNAWIICIINYILV